MSGCYAMKKFGKTKKKRSTALTDSLRRLRILEYETAEKIRSAGEKPEGHKEEGDK